MSGSASSEDGDLGFQIAPMVDVVFVLLIFFMISASFKPVERGLEAAFASPGHGSAVGIISIDITEEGALSVNGTALGDATNRSLPELRSWLKNAMSDGSMVPVNIHPAAGTRQERVIDVLDACAKEKVKGVTFS